MRVWKEVIDLLVAVIGTDELHQPHELVARLPQGRFHGFLLFLFGLFIGCSCHSCPS